MFLCLNLDLVQLKIIINQPGYIVIAVSAICVAQIAPLSCESEHVTSRNLILTMHPPPPYQGIGESQQGIWWLSCCSLTPLP